MEKAGDGKRDKGGAVTRKRAVTGARGVKLEPELQEYIGRELQTIYSDVLKQPVPDRFLELLRRLDNDKAGD